LAAIACQRWAAWRRQPDVALDHDIGRSADQDQMLDVVATHENKPAVAVDGGGVHDGEPRFAVPAAGNEGPESQVADDLDDEQHDDQQNKSRECPQDCSDITRTRYAIQPLQHRCAPVTFFEVRRH
jgi:hypothetical protein